VGRSNRPERAIFLQPRFWRSPLHWYNSSLTRSVHRMKLIRWGPPGAEKPGILTNEGARLDASPFGSDFDEDFFASGGLQKLRAWVASNASGAPHVPGSARLGPPICRPSKIVCIGLNYRDHAAETKAEPPREPVLFFKSTTSLVGPNDALTIPRNAEKVDWEVE